MQSLDQVEFCGKKSWQLHSIDAAHVSHIVRSWWTNEQGYFPGPQPVSIERKHLSSLSNDYRVCEKTDGERFLFVCMKYMKQSVAVLMNRKQDVFLLPLVCSNDIFTGTLLDGELVVNKLTNTYKFIVYDCVRAFGESVVKSTHTERMQAAISVASQIQTTKHLLFTLCIKQFYPFSRMREYVDVVVPALTHAIDGYIFTPNNEPIRTGTHFTMFKWKQRLHNTVDFLVNTNGVHIMNRNNLQLLNGVIVKVPPVLLEAVNKSSSSILECEYVNKMSWRAIRIRDDKTHPNGFLTYKKTLKNIQEDIKLEEFYQG
jgi:hypothetical protein